MKFRLFTIILLLGGILSAQVPKKILMEYATNASCGPCATYNPGNYDHLKANYDITVAVWYHAWWPGPNDPMFVSNEDENRARIQYYGINGVPDYVLNGVEKGWQQDVPLYEEFASDHATFMNLMSPIELEVNHEVIGDSLKVTVDLGVVDEITYSDLVLHTAITEQMRIYPSPPGSNGEIDFPHVFLKFAAGSNGESLPEFNVGDSVKYEYTMEIDEEWNLDVLTMVAWVQSTSTKHVLQSASNLVFFQMVSSAPGIDFIEKGASSLKTYTIENIMEEPLSLRIKSNLVENSENWAYTFSYDGTTFDSVDVTIEPKQSIEFSLNLQTNSETGVFEIDIIADNLAENSNFKSRYNYYAAVTSGDLLIVDDDNGNDYEDNYTRYFNGIEYDYTKLSQEALLKIKDDYSISNFNYVFWNLGIESPSLTAQDAVMLTDYLKDGGYLFIAGQDLGYDIHEVTKLSSPRFLYSIYLDALFLENTDTSTSIIGVPEHPMFADVNIQLNDIYPLSPDAIQSKRGNSIPVLQYADSENAAMLLNIKDEGKTAYLAVGLEQISSTENQDLILSKVMEWFNTPVDVKSDSEILPTRYSLDQNYPNPFNPSTSIAFSIIEKSQVQIKVFDVLGREVSTLVSETMAPGKYSVDFNADNLNSGVYFYTIKTDNFNETKKMVLLK